MKKGKAYVVKGAVEGDRAASQELFPSLPPLPTWLVSSSRAEGVLPYDHGMAGPVGAYEIGRITRSVSKSLHLLEEKLAKTTDDTLSQVNSALAQLLPPQDVHKLVAERFEGNVLLLSLANRADRFRFSRFLLPKLQAALKPKLGAITCRLIDR